MIGDLQAGRISSDTVDIATAVAPVTSFAPTPTPISPTFLSLHGILSVQLGNTSPSDRALFVAVFIRMTHFISVYFSSSQAVALNAMPGLSEQASAAAFIALDRLATSLTTHLTTLSSEDEYRAVVAERDTVLLSLQQVARPTSLFLLARAGVTPATSTNTNSISASLLTLYPSSVSRLTMIRATAATAAALLASPTAVSSYFYGYTFSAAAFNLNTDILYRADAVDLVMYVQMTPSWTPAEEASISELFDVRDRVITYSRSLTLFTTTISTLSPELVVVQSNALPLFATEASPVLISIPLATSGRGPFERLEPTSEGVFYAKFCESYLPKSSSSNDSNTTAGYDAEWTEFIDSTNPGSTMTPFARIAAGTWSSKFCTFKELRTTYPASEAAPEVICSCTSLRSGVGSSTRGAAYLSTIVPSRSSWIGFGRDSIERNPYPLVISTIWVILMAIIAITAGCVDNRKDNQALDTVLHQWPLRQSLQKPITPASTVSSEEVVIAIPSTSLDNELPGFCACVARVWFRWLGDIFYFSSWMRRHCLDPIPSVPRALAASLVIISSFAILSAFLGTDSQVSVPPSTSPSLYAYGVFSSLYIACLATLGSVFIIHLLLSFVLYLLFGDALIRKYLHKYVEELVYLLHIRQRQSELDEAGSAQRHVNLPPSSDFFTSKESEEIITFASTRSSSGTLSLGIFAVAEYAQWSLTLAAQERDEIPPVRDVRSLSYLLRGIFTPQSQTLRKHFRAHYGGVSRMFMSASHAFCLFLLFLIASALLAITLIFGTQISLTRVWTIPEWVIGSVAVLGSHILIVLPVVTLIAAFFYVLGGMCGGKIPFEMVPDREEELYGIPLLSATDSRFKHLHGVIATMNSADEVTTTLDGQKPALASSGCSSPTKVGVINCEDFPSSTRRTTDIIEMVAPVRRNENSVEQSPSIHSKNTPKPPSSRPPIDQKKLRRKRNSLGSTTTSTILSPSINLSENSIGSRSDQRGSSTSSRPPSASPSPAFLPMSTPGVVSPSAYSSTYQHTASDSFFGERTSTQDNGRVTLFQHQTHGLGIQQGFIRPGSAKSNGQQAVHSQPASTSHSSPRVGFGVVFDQPLSAYPSQRDSPALLPRSSPSPSNTPLTGALHGYHPVVPLSYMNHMKLETYNYSIEEGEADTQFIHHSDNSTGPSPRISPRPSPLLSAQTNLHISSKPAVQKRMSTTYISPLSATTFAQNNQSFYDDDEDDDDEFADFEEDMGKFQL